MSRASGAISIWGHAPQRSGGEQSALPAGVRWAALAAIAAVAIVLRAVFVGTQSLGYEEVFTRTIVAAPTLAGVWHGVKATESTPPLYYVLSWLWVQISGSLSATSLRMISLIAGVATVPVSFLAVRRLVGERVALAVAWLCAVSPILVIYSVYARAYALLVLAAALSLWALGALIERPSWRSWLWWTLSAALCLWTHYFAVFVVIAEVCVLLVRLPRARAALALSLLAVAAASYPLWSLFSSQSGDAEKTAYIAAEPLSGRLEGIVRQFAMGTNVPTAWLEAVGIALVVAAALFALARTLSRESTILLLALAVIGAGIPILGAITSIDDRLLARNVLGVWIFVAPLAAYGLTRLRSLPLLAYSVIAIATVIAVQSDWRYQGSTDWSGASARIQARAAGEPVAVMPGIELAVAGLYMQRAPLAAPLPTRNLWVMVQPARGAGERALNPVADPPLASLWGSQFQAVGELDYRGFRLIHLRANTPVTVAPAPSDDGPASSPTALLLAP
jgi:4-amino-4-deoxy-L-arabinose transferase-like glycosyltransferase